MLLKKVDKLLLMTKSKTRQNNPQNNEQIANRTFDKLQMLPINEIEQLLLFEQKLINFLTDEITICNKLFI